MSTPWPSTAADLITLQERLGAAAAPRWPLRAHAVVAGVFICFGRPLLGPGAAGDPAWAGAVLWQDGRLVARITIQGRAAAAYTPGLLALREGSILEAAARALPARPDVLLVNATGQDHPRRAGLALHLGAVLNLPTVGVTHRPLLAVGALPADNAGAWTSLRVADETVGAWLRTRAHARPLAVHAAWRKDVETAVAVMAATTAPAVRTPAPLREARRIAREARTHAAQAHP